MAYDRAFSKPYADGWRDKPSRETPATADIMDAYDAALETHDKRIVELSGVTDSLEARIAAIEALNS